MPDSEPCPPPGEVKASFGQQTGVDSGTIPIHFRRASVADIDPIARLHHRCSRLQPGAFMHRLGVPFFHTYYHLLLNDPNTVVILAETEQGNLLGLVAGCRHADLERTLLRGHRVRLLASCLGHILMTPSLILDLYARMRLIGSPPPGDLGGQCEPRISFWCWDPDSTASRQSTRLLQRFLEHMKTDGAGVVRFEVDRINRKVEITHRLMGARTVHTTQMPDGRERLVMEHVLNSAAP